MRLLWLFDGMPPVSKKAIVKTPILPNEQMKLTPILSFVFLACSLQAASVKETPITSLPATITVPGNYYFVGNMYEPTALWPTGPTGITVNAPGTVVIDLRGFALVGPEYYGIASYGILIRSNDVTIRDGKIEGFMYQIEAGSQNQYPPVPISGVNLLNLYFTACGECSISFGYVNSSVVRDCAFTFHSTGFSGTPGPLIQDGASARGNSYINDRFLGKSFSSSPDTTMCAITSTSNGYTINVVPGK
jgi:hypothetical protein